MKKPLTKLTKLTKLLLISLILIISGCSKDEIETCYLKQEVVQEYRDGELWKSNVPENPIVLNADDYDNVEIISISEQIDENTFIISTYKRFCQ